MLINIYIESIILAIFLDSFTVMKNLQNTTTVKEVGHEKAVKKLGMHTSKKFKIYRKLRLEEILHKDYMESQRFEHIKDLARNGVLDGDAQAFAEVAALKHAATGSSRNIVLSASSPISRKKVDDKSKWEKSRLALGVIKAMKGSRVSSLAKKRSSTSGQGER